MREVGRRVGDCVVVVVGDPLFCLDLLMELVQDEYQRLQAENRISSYSGNASTDPSAYFAYEGVVAAVTAERTSLAKSSLDFNFQYSGHCWPPIPPNTSTHQDRVAGTLVAHHQSLVAKACGNGSNYTCHPTYAWQRTYLKLIQMSVISPSLSISYLS